VKVEFSRRTWDFLRPKNPAGRDRERRLNMHISALSSQLSALVPLGT
jgi:hypothetical protein